MCPWYLRAVLIFALSIGCARAALADAYNFQTPEYWASTGLESIQAAEAYALGFTGAGVIIGVVDNGFAPAEGEFAGKYPYGIFGEENTGGMHGIHVSGIMAALKNDYGMHGVAFDAKLLPWLFQGNAHIGWKKMLEYSDVRIVNNSWAIMYHLDASYYSGFWVDVLDAYDDFVTLAGAMAAQDKLMVMGAGNDGHLAPVFTAGLPTLLNQQGENNSIGLNWLNVSAYNPAYSSSHPAFVWPSTNMGQGASEYTLMAPGVDINSTISSRDYGIISGTSMATPYVSGVAALVQQAFPYMGGKQMADVLLSTATPMTGASQPRYFVLMRETYDDDLEITAVEVIAYSTSSVTNATDEEKAAIFQAMSPYAPAEWDAVSLRSMIDAASSSPTVLTQAAYDALFGQGMVNACRAVQGPGYFNAKRLDERGDLAVNVFGDGNNYAMYGVNTQGYASVWSNDIGERQADSGTLANLGVGLRKSGEGLLYLTGTNTYSGPTEILRGGISLGTVANHASASLAGSVYVRDSGLFTGAGRVGGDLYSTGVLAPGFASLPGTTLSVGGGVTSSGVLRIFLGQRGLATGMDAATMDLSGSSLQLLKAAGQEIEPYADYCDVLSATGGIGGLEGLPSRFVLSPFLSYSLTATGGNSLSLISSTSDLDTLPGLPAKTRNVASGLQHMFNSLSSSPLQDQLDFLYSQDAGSFEETVAALRGDLQAATLTALPFTGMLQKLIASPPMGSLSAPATEQENMMTSLGPAGLNVWMRPVLGYASADGKSSLRQDNVVSRMRGLVIGLNRNADDFYGGALLAIGNSEVEQGRNEATIIDTRLGLYGGCNPGGLRLSGLVSGGWQHYRTSRHIPTATGRDHLKSSFNGYSLGFGAEAAYNLLHGFSGGFAVSPYIGFDADNIRQEDRKESGNAVFALDVESKKYWRTAVRPGLTLDYSPVEWLTLTASAGYKRLLSGDSPSLDVSFKADPAYRFEAVGVKEGRDFVTYSVGVEAALPHNFKLAASFFGENSGRSRAYSGYVNMIFAW